MKKILLLAMCVAFFNNAYSQHICGTSEHAQNEMIKRIERFNEGHRNHQISLRDDTLLYVPMQFHLVADDNGEGRVSPISVLEQWEGLIIDYTPGGFYPVLADEFNFFDDNRVYSDPGGNGGIVANNSNQSAVNVFITDKADTGNSLGTTLGYYTPQWDYLVVKRSEITEVTSTLAHELGHYFSLPHTFYGWEAEPYDATKHGNPVDIVRTPVTNQLIELMDGSNCEDAADKICDTPPDYNFGFGNSGCSMDQIVRDYNGDTIVPMVNNYMGYFIGCPKYEFTQGQWDVVTDDYYSSRRNKIRPDGDIEIVEVAEDFQFNYPSDGETIDSYQYVTVDWEDVEGATHYAVQFSSGNQSFGAVVTSSDITVPELLPDEFYAVSVRAFNMTHPGVNKYSLYFETGDQTSVIDESIISEVKVIPNPVQSGNVVRVEVEAHEVLLATYQIMDINGRVVEEADVRLTPGRNTISIDSYDMNSGLYFVQINSEKGSLQKKIIVQ